MSLRTSLSTWSNAARDSLLLLCFVSSRRRHTRLQGDWSSDVCSSDLFHLRVMRDDDFKSGAIDIQWLERRLDSLVASQLSDAAIRIAAVTGALLAARDRGGQIGRASCRGRG